MLQFSRGRTITMRGHSFRSLCSQNQCPLIVEFLYIQIEEINRAGKLSFLDRLLLPKLHRSMTKDAEDVHLLGWVFSVPQCVLSESLLIILIIIKLPHISNTSVRDNHRLFLMHVWCQAQYTNAEHYLSHFLDYH